MSQPVPNTGLIYRCPVCLLTSNAVPDGVATVVTPNGYACCTVHAPIVAEHGLEDAVILAQRSLNRSPSTTLPFTLPVVFLRG